VKIIGNIIWVLFGGLIIAIEYLIGSIVLMITIIGIPFGIQTLKLATLAIWPFGRTTKVHARASGCLYIIMNFIWLITAGIATALTHIVLGLLFYITIIGIPFGNQHLKLANIALTPFGRDIVNC
jgi:uncharacterized membrane protein YccF (DUF307 family)